VTTPPCQIQSVYIPYLEIEVGAKWTQTGICGRSDTSSTQTNYLTGRGVYHRFSLPIKWEKLGKLALLPGDCLPEVSQPASLTPQDTHCTVSYLRMACPAPNAYGHIVYVWASTRTEYIRMACFTGNI
jgi:hypothetical protein